MRSKDAILAAMLNKLPDEYQKTEGFPIHDILSVVATGLETQNSDVEFAANQNNVYQLTGDHLAQFINERTGLERKSGAGSWGYLQITTNQNVTIPAGSVFATATGSLMFQTLADVEIGTTTADVYAECTTTGIETNVPVDSINRMAITIPGVTNITNDSAFTGGADAETDEELRERYILHIKNPSASGNKLDYKEWATEIEGVANARVIPLWNGDNTVKVVVIGEDNTVPSTTVINKVQEYIDPNSSGSGEGVAPIGAYCTVVAVSKKTVDVAATIYVDESFLSSTVQQAVVDNIKDWFAGLDVDVETITATQLMKVIFNTDGVTDCSVPTLNGGSSVSITDTQIASAGTITITLG